ncbi:MAG: MFS transporter [Sphingobium sp.]
MANDHFVDDNESPYHQNRSYGYFSLFIISIIYILNYLDRQLLAVLAEPIKNDLHLSDSQLGLLTGTLFALFYTALGLPVAWLADRTHRVRLIAVACSIWSAFTAMTGLATNFTHVAFARVGSAVAEAGGVSPSYSLISDLFPVHKRGAAIALFNFGMPLGLAGGVAYGAFMTENFGWRSAFLWLGVPGVLLSIALPLLVKEPRRGQNEENADVGLASLSQTILTFVRDRNLRFLLIGGIFSAFIHYALLIWTPVFLMRVQGMSLNEMAAFYSPAIGFAVAGGGLMSGVVFDRLLKRTNQAYALLSSVSALLALPAFLLGVSANSWELGVIFLTIAQFFTGMFVAPIMAVVLNSFPPAQRSTACATLLLVLTLVAMGLGPLFIGGVSDLAGTAYGKQSLRIAMYALIPFFLIAGGINYRSPKFA